jgi:DNA-binding response OmpR family regulator
VKILVIEDDTKTAQAIRKGLAGEGYETAVAKTGEEGFFLLSTEVFDAVILDWMLPGRDGIEILKTIRARGMKTPVLLLTARDAVEDRVLGLDSGADDYLVKPFAFAELLARIRVLLRRAGQDEPLRKQVGDLVVDIQTRRVMRSGQEIALTPREFDLLVYLMRYQGQISRGASVGAWMRLRMALRRQPRGSRCGQRTSNCWGVTGRCRRNRFGGHCRWRGKQARAFIRSRWRTSSR